MLFFPFGNQPDEVEVVEVSGAAVRLLLMSQNARTARRAMARSATMIATAMIAPLALLAVAAPDPVSLDDVLVEVAEVEVPVLDGSVTVDMVIDRTRGDVEVAGVVVVADVDVVDVEVVVVVVTAAATVNGGLVASLVSELSAKNW